MYYIITMSTAEKKQDAFKGCGAPVMSETFKERGAPETFKGRGGSAGGIGGSGIYGGIGAGVVCDSKDTSLYCMFIKFVTVIIYFVILISIFSYVYMLFRNTKLGRRLFGGR
jgi:hypothetical protein